MLKPDGLRGGMPVGSLLEKSLVIMLSAVLLGVGLLYLSERVMPLLKQIYESVAKLLVAG
ncbi:MAG: hypothetical protein QXU11_05700 [Thermoproteota archaeon]